MNICKLKSSAIEELLSEKLVFCNNDRFKVTNCKQTQYKGNFQKAVLQTAVCVSCTYTKVMRVGKKSERFR